MTKVQRYAHAGLRRARAGLPLDPHHALAIARLVFARTRDVGNQRGTVRRLGLFDGSASAVDSALNRLELAEGRS